MERYYKEEEDSALSSSSLLAETIDGAEQVKKMNMIQWSTYLHSCLPDDMLVVCFLQPPHFLALTVLHVYHVEPIK